jgi:hypothetical protein
MRACIKSLTHICTRPGHVWGLVLALLAAGATGHAAEQQAAIKLAITPPAPLEVKAFWEPVTESQYGFGQKWPELRDFRPAKAVQVYAASDFAALLPPGPVQVGGTWPIDKAGCVKFLRQFHAGATSDLHLDNGDSPKGGLALLARYNDELAVILARYHGEFVLNEGWLTPGQFQGTLVLDRKSGKVKFFRWHVPMAAVNFDTGRKIFDLRALGLTVPGLKGPALDGEIGGQRLDPKNPPVITDTGILPRMELLGGNPAVADGQNWTASISDEAAWDQIEKELYSFRKVEWVAFDNALETARRMGKPLHVVSVDGTLCDESCCGTGKKLRAGPLSNPRIARLLNDKCINTWVLNSRLPSLRDQTENVDAKTLATAILASRQKGSPVDSIVFTSGLRPVSVLGVNYLPGKTLEATIDPYEDFLKVALEKIALNKDRQ